MPREVGGEQTWLRADHLPGNGSYQGESNDRALDFGGVVERQNSGLYELFERENP